MKSQSQRKLVRDEARTIVNNMVPLYAAINAKIRDNRAKHEETVRNKRQRLEDQADNAGRGKAGARRPGAVGGRGRGAAAGGRGRGAVAGGGAAARARGLGEAAASPSERGRGAAAGGRRRVAAAGARGRSAEEEEQEEVQEEDQGEGEVGVAPGPEKKNFFKQLYTAGLAF